jgi:hypothetical protein
MSDKSFIIGFFIIIAIIICALIGFGIYKIVEMNTDKKNKNASIPKNTNH